jgi:hypothetical protein
LEQLVRQAFKVRLEQLVQVAFKAKLELQVQVAFRAKSAQLVRVDLKVQQDRKGHKDHRDRLVQVAFRAM